MGTGIKFGLVVLIVAVVLAVVIVPMWVSASNKEIGLRNLAAAQEDVCKMVFDETWKIINQQAQVANEYKEAFREIFPELMEGRYGNDRGGSLMSWISEQNPEFDSALYIKIQSSIESQRHKYTEAQKMLRDVKLQHDDLRTKLPTSIFVGGRPVLEVTIVTSSKTENVYEEAKEDDVNLFNRGK